jgi:DNA-directed RNA polymerase subunit RPC12/RpoP
MDYIVGNKEIETFTTDEELMCPYCGYIHQIDAEDLSMMAFETNDSLNFDDYIFTCPKCEKKYKVEREVSFTYETFRLED